MGHRAMEGEHRTIDDESECLANQPNIDEWTDRQLEQFTPRNEQKKNPSRQ